MKQVKIDLTHVDWELLREQKYELLRLFEPYLECSADTDLLKGIVHLIDDIQDQAAEQLGEQLIFGELQ